MLVYSISLVVLAVILLVLIVLGFLTVAIENDNCLRFWTAAIITAFTFIVTTSVYAVLVIVLLL